MKLFRKALLSFFLISLSSYSFAADPINTTWFGNLAVEGYDTVAYFTESRAIKGDKDFELEWNGANWRFSSQENLELFRDSPEKYVPQYGGYCAWAASNNSIAGIDPEQFDIVEGKLYLNYNAKIHQQWLPEKEHRINLADKNWPELVD